MNLSEILGDLFSGVTFLFSAAGIKTLVMFIIAGVLIYLASALSWLTCPLC